MNAFSPPREFPELDLFLSFRNILFIIHIPYLLKVKSKSYFTFFYLHYYILVALFMEIKSTTIQNLGELLFP